MHPVVIALKYLTSFQFGKPKGFKYEELKQSVPFFPLIGVFLGMLLVLENLLFAHLLPKEVVSVLILFTLFVITNKRLYKGAGYVSEAYFNGKNSTQRESIIKSYPFGYYGILGIFFAIILKYSALNSITDEHQNQMIATMPLYSRWSIAYLAFSTSLKGADSLNCDRLFPKIDFKEFSVATFFLVLGGVLTLGIQFFLIFVINFIVTISGQFILNKTFKNLSDSIIGAFNEFTEVSTILTGFILIW